MAIPASGFSLNDVRNELGLGANSSLADCIADVGKTGTWDRLTDFANYENTITVTPATKNVDFAGEVFEITITTSSVWTALPTIPSWITLSSYAFPGNSVIDCTVANNTGGARNYTIVFDNHGVQDTCAITQDAAP